MNKLQLVLSYLVLSFIIISLSSCWKDDEFITLSTLNEDHFVFGHFYGECGGETCIETFALTTDKLYEDTNDVYLGTTFDFVELPNDKFELATGLELFFPTDLLDETDQVFGCPDCGDWGGIYVEYVEDGERRSWQIDVMLDDVPSYLHQFVGEIQDRIELINE